MPLRGRQGNLELRSTSSVRPPRCWDQAIAVPSSQPAGCSGWQNLLGLQTFLLHHPMAKRAPSQKAAPGVGGQGLGPTGHLAAFPLRSAGVPTCPVLPEPPSGLTAPAPTWGSGLKELQAVWLQAQKDRAVLGPVAQMSMAVHIPPPASPASAPAWRRRRPLPPPSLLHLGGVDGQAEDGSSGSGSSAPCRR